MVVEVMGRYAGWIALQAGIAGGADVILLPEIPYDPEKVAAAIRKRESFGAKFSIVVVAEGAKPVGGAVTLREAARAGYVERLGGVGIVLAEQLEEMTGREARCVVLGHLQRGGGPTAFDRVLATQVRRSGGGVDSARRVRKDGGEQSAGHRADPAGGCRRPNQDGAARFRSDQDRARDRRVARRLVASRYFRIKSRYFNAPPVLKSTTVSCFLIVPAATS